MSQCPAILKLDRSTIHCVADDDPFDPAHIAGVHKIHEIVILQEDVPQYWPYLPHDPHAELDLRSQTGARS